MANLSPNPQTENIAQITISPGVDGEYILLKITGYSDDKTVVGVRYLHRCASVSEAVESLNDWMKGVIIV